MAEEHILHLLTTGIDEMRRRIEEAIRQILGRLSYGREPISVGSGLIVNTMARMSVNRPGYTLGIWNVESMTFRMSCLPRCCYHSISTYNNTLYCNLRSDEER